MFILKSIFLHKSLQLPRHKDAEVFERIGIPIFDYLSMTFQT